MLTKIFSVAYICYDTIYDENIIDHQVLACDFYEKERPENLGENSEKDLAIAERNARIEGVKRAELVKFVNKFPVDMGFESHDVFVREAEDKVVIAEAEKLKGNKS